MMRQWMGIVSRYLHHPVAECSEHSREEIEEELAFHIDQQTDANRRQGMSDHEARRAALQRFGDHQEIASRLHRESIHGLQWVHRLHLAATATLAGCVLCLMISWWLGGTGTDHESVQLPPAVASLMNERWTGDVRGVVRDDSMSPVANASVLMAVKTWPGGSFFQRAYVATTDARGRFHVDDVCPVNDRYEVQIAVVADGFQLQSTYEEVEVDELHAVNFRLTRSKPLLVRIEDEDGLPLPGVNVVPHQRLDRAGRRHVVYFDSASGIVRRTDASGAVSFPYFRPGDLATFLVEVTPGNWVSGQVRVPAPGTVASIRTAS